MLTNSLVAQRPKPPPRKEKPETAQDRTGFQEDFDTSNYTPGRHARQGDRDQRLERVIYRVHTLLTLRPSRARWRRLCRLIGARSPEMVRRLEEERGLAPAGVT